ncbi:MAG: DUF805 domain-containing protein [Spirochaetes bacterium]|nr:DUF805 domain-containing protein [Spirochaetota bacterium]
MAFCAHCGTKLNEDARFCNSCRVKIDEAVGGEQNPYAPPQYNTIKLRAKKSPWQYFTGAMKKYAVFEGRARRAEFWWFTLFALLLSIPFVVLDVIFDLYIAGNPYLGVFDTLWSLAILIPSISVTVRRMHDCNKSGWFMLIPIYGWIILPLTNGTYGPNRFGADPKHENNPEENQQNI